MRLPIAALVAAFLLAAFAPAKAASLQVSPALIDLTAPEAAATVTLRNTGKEPIDVQLRVLAWSQANGQESLAPTDEAVASPPAVTLAPDVSYVARIVRVSRQPVEAERAMRLVIDEVPTQRATAGSVIRIAIRYSIPVFVSPANRSGPKVDWQVLRRGGRIFVRATNSGQTRLRVAALNVTDAGGRSVSFGSGLTGYVLANSVMEFESARVPQGFASSGVASITAQGSAGTIRATAPITQNP